MWFSVKFHKIHKITINYCDLPKNFFSKTKYISSQSHSMWLMIFRVYLIMIKCHNLCLLTIKEDIFIDIFFFTILTEVGVGVGVGIRDEDNHPTISCLFPTLTPAVLQLQPQLQHQPHWNMVKKNVDEYIFLNTKNSFAPGLGRCELDQIDH